MKDRIYLVSTALIITMLIIVGASYLWSRYEFRVWVCETSNGGFCYKILPPPEEYRRKVAKSWKEKTGQSMENF